MGAGVAYWLAVLGGAVITVLCCVAARRWPGRQALWTARCLAVVLAVDAVTFLAQPLVDGDWTARSSLPLFLCDVASVVAAVACWWPRWRFGVELTYFWGLAGTLQAVLTPDLYVRFPHLLFFEFVVGHLGIVMAACYLVVGMRLFPRPGAVVRVFAVTAAFTAAVGPVDWLLDANYMYLAGVPGHSSLLSLLGPWPYYIVSATGVAVVLLAVLDAPFWRLRRADARRPSTARQPVAAR